MFFKNNDPPAPVVQDFLLKKQDSVDRLMYQASTAVNLVQQTMNDLESINQQIDKDLDEIDAYAKQLSATRAVMDQQRKHNTAVIANFAKLLDTAEDS